MRYRLMRFMAGRNGLDSLNRFLLGVCIVVVLFNLFLRSAVFSILGYLLLILVYFRIFSRNLAKRGAENQRYLRYQNSFLHWKHQLTERFRQRKTHRFYRCPACHTNLRVPKGKGKIFIRCPKCGEGFERKT
ncbi:MAG: hypothetical protein ACOX7K_05235 [Oscillospiraceae bacterium]|jgi:uncharacterized C2H2 Zn-finger protein